MGKIQGNEEEETPGAGEPVTPYPPLNSRTEQPPPVGRPWSPTPATSYPQNFPTGQPASVGLPWSTGLFDCHLNQTNAIMTAFLPCVTFGQIAEVLDSGELTCPLGSFIYLLMMPVVCTQWIMGSKYRTKLRTRYDLVEAPYQDVVSHIFCPCCSLCQEFRELQSRGLDPALGWKGILAQQEATQYGNEQINKPPPDQAMFR